MVRKFDFLFLLSLIVFAGSIPAHADLLLPRTPVNPDAAYQEYIFPQNLRGATAENPGLVILKEVLRETGNVAFHRCHYIMAKKDRMTDEIRTFDCEPMGRINGYSMDSLVKAGEKLESDARLRHKLQFVSGAVVGVVAWRTTTGMHKLLRVGTTVTASVTGLFLTSKIMRAIFPKEEFAGLAQVDSVEPNANLQGEGVEQSFVFINADMRQVEKAVSWLAIKAAAYE